MAVAAVGDDLLGHPLRRFGIDIGDDDRRTLARQCLGIGLADATTGSGDDGDLVFEPHGFPLWLAD